MMWTLIVRDIGGNDKGDIVKQLLVPRSEIIFDTLVCPLHALQHAREFQLSVVLENAQEETVRLCEFPRVCLDSLDVDGDLGGIHKVRDYEHNGLRLVCEYHRKRVGESRLSSADNAWNLQSIVIEFVKSPPILDAIAKHLEHRYKHEEIEKQMQDVADAIKIHMEEEQRLKLALVDVKCALSEHRQTLTAIQKKLLESQDVYDQTLANITMSSSTMTTTVS